MYTNDNDLYSLLSILNDAAYVIAPILFLSGMALFAYRKSKQVKSKSQLIIAISLTTPGLVVGLFAYSGAMKPQCCGEGYTRLQVVQTGSIS